MFILIVLLPLHGLFNSDIVLGIFTTDFLLPPQNKKCHVLHCNILYAIKNRHSLERKEDFVLPTTRLIINVFIIHA